MIIRFFKSAYFSRLVVLALLLIAFQLPEIFIPSKILPEQTGYLSLSPWLQQGIIVLLFFIIALFINRIGTKHRLTDRNSYLTAFFFILTGSSTGFLTHLNVFLPAAFFFALFYQKIFNLQNSTKIITTAFDAGFFLGLTSLFFPPVLFLIFFIWVALLVYQAGQWRPYFTAVFGIILPWFFVFSGYFWFDKLPEAITAFLQYFHFREVWNPFTGTMDLAMFFLIILTTIISGLSLLGRLSSYNISLRQHATVSLWGTLLISLVVFLSAVPLQSLILTDIPFALVISLFFIQIKRQKWANLFVLLWILLIFIHRLLPLFYAA